MNKQIYIAREQARSHLWKVYERGDLGHIAQLRRLPLDVVEGIKVAAAVFPFKVNQYVLENLIQWNDAPDDPIFRLTFPTLEMIPEEFRDKLQYLLARSDLASDANNFIASIRDSLNPHSSDQLQNLPFIGEEVINGVQHKYKETVLAFPKSGQTCHSYCTFCFRWPQFVPTSTPKFELREENILHQYLKEKTSVSDLLLTGGDPLVMNTRRLAEYLDPLTDENFSHVKNIRLGTKALSYWPHRFLGDEGQNLFSLFERLRAAGKNVALMAHINHWKELQPSPVHEAVEKLNRAGVIIRTQSPILRNINDESEIWERSWREQTQMGMVPYYMFIERDTGASRHFSIPIAKALQIYQQAHAGLSGLGRTARGPVMSASPGKIHVVGALEINGAKKFVLNFIQAREPKWLNKLFLADHDENATWIDQLKPADAEKNFFFQKSH